MALLTLIVSLIITSVHVKCRENSDTYVYSLYLFQLWRAGVNGGHKETRERTRSGTCVPQHPVNHLRLIFVASSACAGVPQTVAYSVNATSCVVCKTWALKEMCVGGGRSISALVVLEILVATQFSFSKSGTVVRANSYLQAVVCYVVLSCSYSVCTESRVLVSSLSVSGSVKCCIIM